MPVIVKLPSGNWRAQVRRKGNISAIRFGEEQMLTLGHWKLSALLIGA